MPTTTTAAIRLSMVAAHGPISSGRSCIGITHRTVEARDVRPGLIATAVVARRVDELGGLSPTVTIESVRDRIWTLNTIEMWHLVTVTLS